MPQFLIIAPGPEAEPHVAALRAKFDPAATRGLGAHITLLHRNRRSEQDQPRVEAIATAVAASPAFRYRLTRVARFPGTVYLAAEPAAPFEQLRSRLLEGLQL